MYYASDIREIKEEGHVNRLSGLIRLQPFIDGRGLLRLRGRIANANVSDDERHPIILPPHCQFVRLLMREAHLKQSHGNLQEMRHYVRARYWIVEEKRAALRVLKSCVICLRHVHADGKQLMADLPKERLSFLPPFTYCGVDYFGPISVQKFEGRCNSTIAGYVAIFICMTTKMIHMECCSNLKSEQFIWALSRFSAIYRTPIKMMSDNGRTFVGSDN